MGKIPDDDVVQVDHDNVGACKELVTVLFAKGIQNIAYLGSNMDQMVNRCRYQDIGRSLPQGKTEAEPGPGLHGSKQQGYGGKSGGRAEKQRRGVHSVPG